MAEDRLVDLRHTVADNEQLQLFVREAAQHAMTRATSAACMIAMRQLLAALVHVHEAASDLRHAPRARCLAVVAAVRH